MVEGLPGPFNAVPFWVWYGFWVRIPIRTPKKVLHWRVQVGFRVINILLSVGLLS